MPKKIFFILFLMISSGTLIFVLSGNFSTYETEKVSSLNSSNLTMMFTGDVMLSRGVNSALESNVNVFNDLTPLFKSSDMVVVNLEGPFTRATNPTKSSYFFKVKPEHAKLLTENNIKVAFLANNHIMDYGEEGLDECIATLKKNNISYAGAGSSLEEAIRPTYVEKNGSTIAFINFMDRNSFLEYSSEEMPFATQNRSGYAPAEVELIKKSIGEAKNQSDFVVVSFHYGNEMTSSPNQMQYLLSRESIDAGADLVIGHHPHVIQKIENYKGKLIFYSLGNCIFDAVTPAARKSMVVEFKLKKGDAEIILHPIYISNSQTFLMDQNNGEEFLSNLQSISSPGITIKNGKGIIFLKDYL